jgi:TolB-like protein/Flp pilus assembly protein TadD
MKARRLRFVDYELDFDNQELTRRGRSIKLERIPLTLLMLLIERRERLVTREEIANKLWGDGVFVDVDNGINTAVLKLRRVFRDSPQNPVFIKTVSARGYRFIAPVTEAEAQGASFRGSSEPVRRVTLAILPFENLSADPEQEYFSDGLTEETICHLGRINPGALGLIARTSSMAYKRTSKGIGQIGRELGVSFVLESSVRREDGRVRVACQLISAADQTHLWAATFDSDATSYLAMQHELSTAIAEQVQVKLLPESGGFAHSPHNMDAFDLYLRGRYQWNQLTPPAIQRAIAYFEKSIALDPHYALAWSGIADCYSMLPITCDAPAREILPKALAAARRAVELDDGLAETHTSLGTVKVWMDWDWPGAEAALRRALEINPNYVQAHRYYACLLCHTGRHAEAAAEMDKARAADPLSPIMHALSGQLRAFARDYETAIRHLRDAQTINPDLWIVHAFLGRVHECEGRLEQAKAEYQRAFELSGGGNTEPIAFRARAAALLGDRAAAEEAIHTLTELSARKYVPPYNVATIHAGLGDMESAFCLLEKAYETRDVRLVFLLVDPRWDSVRRDARFLDLSSRLHLLPESTSDSRTGSPRRRQAASVTQSPLIVQK